MEMGMQTMLIFNYEQLGIIRKPVKLLCFGSSYYEDEFILG